MRFQGGVRQTLPRECVPRYGRFAGHRCRPERSGLLAACGRRFGRSAVVDEVGGDVAGGQFELAGFDDRELLAYETFGSGCHNGRDDSYAISFTQIELMIHQLI
jgi:hypothetical protein